MEHRTIYYTKKGDSGKTSDLFSRKSKADEIFDVLGNLDELNSFIGLLISSIKLEPEKHVEFLRKLQCFLLDMGSDIASFYSLKDSLVLNFNEFKYNYAVEYMEHEMDMNTHPLLREFLLPGNNINSIEALCHICRTITRRTERSLCKLTQKLSKNDYRYIQMTLNRLSSFFFFLAREFGPDTVKSTFA